MITPTISRQTVPVSRGVLRRSGVSCALHLKRCIRKSNVREESTRAIIPSRTQPSADSRPAFMKPPNDQTYQPQRDNHNPGQTRLKHEDQFRAARRKPSYPLYPSVIQLLHEKSIGLSEVEKIPVTGPNGRLLKGDVLAYVGAIEPSYTEEQSGRIASLGHLDLSKIKLAESHESTVTTPDQNTSASSTKPAAHPPQTFSVAISLQAVREIRKRVQTTLGVEIPLDTFISRAIEISNDNLPPAVVEPTADELFAHVLGLEDADWKTAYGKFMPQISPLSEASLRPTGADKIAIQEQDILNILINNTNEATTTKVPTVSSLNRSEITDIFTVTAAKGEERRADIFLKRVKSMLEGNPGNLILDGSAMHK